MQPRILAARLDAAQKRIVAAVKGMAGESLPALPEHRDPQQQALFRLEWIADRLEEMAQPEVEAAEKPKKKAVKGDE